MSHYRFLLFFLIFPMVLVLSHALQPSSEHEKPSTDSNTLPEVVVTAIREDQPLSLVPASVGILSAPAIRFAAPSHPQQILGQVPGVALSATNGEGHTTAIRQPFSTSPLYLFLEDGIPVRPTGFFNHNALYEVNIPQAGGVEVIRGPGSALYGSDAIGGVVNILTARPGMDPAVLLSSEGGSFGWLRLLGSLQSGVTRFGSMRLDLNMTHSDGWRRQTGYDRLGGNFRWDYAFDSDTSLKTVISHARIDQRTGANSTLGIVDYFKNPRTNLFSIAFREVEALRISSAFEKKMGDGLLAITPYFRRNRMDLSGSYNLPNDPRFERTENDSYGILAKWRQDFPNFYKARFVGGLDLEGSPGSRAEDEWIIAARNATPVGTLRNYRGYQQGAKIYDYDVTFRSASPYLHGEISPNERLRVTAGIRYDLLGFSMDNRLSGGAIRSGTMGSVYWGQSGSVEKRFSRLVPKVGFTYEINEKNSVYTSYNQAYRIPSESQLFRGGRATSAVAAQARSTAALGLEPILATQYEIGARGRLSHLDYSLAFYQLNKTDDLVNWRDSATNVSTNVNAGETRSRGAEAGLGIELGRWVRIDTALSFARHSYVDWINRTGAASYVAYSGNEMPQAPRFIGNTRISFSPLEPLKAQLEWIRIGSYYLQDSNLPTTAGADSGVSKYEGHHLFNFRMSYDVCQSCTIFARILNLADKRYADSASVTSNTAVYAPGSPRAFFAGIELKF